MKHRIDTVTSDLKNTATDAAAAFSNLSTEQLNWKPAEKSWSIAQCLDHLIKTHSLYFPLFARMAGGHVKPTFWEKTSPLSGYFGRFLIKGLDPENQKKMKTTGKAHPSASDIDDGIVERFCQHQQAMIEHLKKLPDDLEPKTTIVTSPLLGFVTYSLDDTFTILVHHSRRHLNQAKRVSGTKGFPKS
jgi:uncharacterized damage-inducible protein DinB